MTSGQNRYANIQWIHYCITFIIVPFLYNVFQCKTLHPTIQVLSTLKQCCTLFKLEANTPPLYVNFIRLYHFHKKVLLFAFYLPYRILLKKCLCIFCCDYGCNSSANCGEDHYNRVYQMCGAVQNFGIFALPDLHEFLTELDAKQAQTTCANKIEPGFLNDL